MSLLGLGLGRNLPNPRFPDPALHWMRQPLPRMGGGSGASFGGGGGMLSRLGMGGTGGGIPSAPRFPAARIPKGLK